MTRIPGSHTKGWSLTIAGLIQPPDHFYNPVPKRKHTCIPVLGAESPPLAQHPGSDEGKDPTRWLLTQAEGLENFQASLGEMLQLDK